MSVHITYFVHGTTVDNENNISSGWYDVELSDLGVGQAKDLRDLANDQKFDAVFCSDLKRAADTARLAFEGSAPIIPDARLRECNYGDYNAKLEVLLNNKTWEHAFADDWRKTKSWKPGWNYTFE